MPELEKSHKFPAVMSEDFHLFLTNTPCTDWKSLLAFVLLILQNHLFLYFTFQFFKI